MIARLSWIAALLAGISTLVIAILISADVLLRYFLNSPLLFVDETASFLLVLVIFGGLAYTFLSGGHVRVDLVTTHLRPALRAWLRAGGLALGIVFIILVSWTTLQSALTAYRYGRVSTVMLYPLWAPMLLIPAGLLLMSVVMLGALRRQVRTALGPPAGRDELPAVPNASLTDALLGSLLIGLMFLLLALGLEVSIALGLVGLLGLLYLKGFSVGLGVIGSIAWSNATSFSFIAVPLFVFMSGILLHSGIGRGLFRAMARWVGFLPGGLAVASIFSCAVFAAVSGSSVATAATIGMIAIPEMERRGYQRSVIIGSLAAGGTLGILIPPSIPMIIYGVMTETSVGHLYMAGIVPGILLSLIFAAYVVVYAMIWPEAAPRAAEDRGSLASKLEGLREVLPVAILIVVVLGSMYLGIVTPTEAAALGTMVSLVLAWWAGTLTWVAMRRAFEETVRTTSMVMAIIIFAAIFSHVIALIGAPKALLAYVVSLGLPQWAFFTAIFSFLLVIAYALEELSVMIILLPILFPLITGLGFDPVWFGIIMVVWLEIGFITPPVGLNLFVIQGLMPGSTAREVTVGTTPYVLLMILMVVLLFLFPDLALWLPRQMMAR